MEPMEHLNSSRDHLETWSNLTRLISWGTGAIVVLLLVMAATLV